MKFINQFLFTTLLFISFCDAQMVLNTESLRVDMLAGKQDWSGNAGINFSFVKNTNDIYNISTKLALGYNGGDNLWMIISNFQFQKIEGNAFQNSGMQHFRYNRQLNKRFTFEAFLQGQYDKISNVDFRGLAGIGPRYEFTKKHDSKKKYNTKKRSRVFLGTLIMYEYEKSSEIDMGVKQKDVRGSNYLSFSIFPTNLIEVISTTYYQPRLDLIKDYRLSSDLIINLKFSENKKAALIPHETELHNEFTPKPSNFWNRLSFNISFNYNYDAFPVTSVPKTQYSLTNGLRYDF